MADRTPIHFNHRAKIYENVKEQFPVIADLILQFDAIFTSENYHCSGLIFRNCEFTGEVQFYGTDLKLGVRFIDCLFRKKCFFIETKAEGIKDSFNDDNVSILFKNCTHEKTLSFSKSDFERSIRLEQQTEIGDINIAEITAQSIDFYECKLSGLDVEYIKTKVGFRIEKSEVSGKGRYFGITGAGLTLMGSSFLRDHLLWANEVDSIGVNDSVFEDDFQIKACASASYTLYGTKFKKGLTIITNDPKNGINAVIKSLFIKNCDFQGGLLFSGYKQLAGIANIEKLSVSCSNLLLGSLTFENTCIIELVINGTNPTASINFQKCDFKALYIDNFVNQGKLYFADMECYDRNGSVFSVAKTSLGSTIFLNINLLHFQSVIIKHSHLTDIIFTDVKWFNPVQLNPVTTFTDDVTSDEIYQFKKGVDRQIWALIKTKREVYRQLKYTAARLGDSVQSLVFQGEEMRLYKEELGYYKLFKGYNGNKAMMWVNQTNNYGNDWLKPVGILLVVNVCFYLVIDVLQSNSFYLLPSFNSCDINATGDLWGGHLDVFWSLLNPIRKLSDLFPANKSFSAWTVFFDYLDRIVVSYFIFQIVSAFRKYTRGS